MASSTVTVHEDEGDQENEQMVKMFDSKDSEKKPEKTLKIGDHYLVRRSNNTWRKYKKNLIMNGEWNYC